LKLFDFHHAHAREANPMRQTTSAVRENKERTRKVPLDSFELNSTSGSDARACRDSWRVMSHLRI
jgi:hypothetical protein